MKIAVGLSGGVDSSVAALLLRDQGHEVTGITMRLWRGTYRGGTRDACYGPGEEEDIARARRGSPFDGRTRRPRHVCGRRMPRAGRGALRRGVRPVGRFLRRRWHGAVRRHYPGAGVTDDFFQRTELMLSG